MNQNQQGMIEYPKEETKVLRERLGTWFLKIRVSLLQDAPNNSPLLTFSS